MRSSHAGGSSAARRGDRIGHRAHGPHEERDARGSVVAQPVSATWLHCDPLPALGEATELDADEARHASGARRLCAGDAITLFDGRGGLAHATLDDASSRKTIVARVHGVESVPQPRPALRLGVALPKGDRQSTLVSMTTQLGVQAIVPIHCARSVARPGRNAEERWQRVAIAACKQSRNPWLPEYGTELRAAAFAERSAREGPCIVLHPSDAARPLAEVAREVAAQRVGGLAVMIGPEGGFADDEIDACARSGALAASLGSTILRTETAAVAALAIVRALLDEA